MNDTDFEKDSRAHSFWQEWQDAADRAGDPGTYLESQTWRITHKGEEWDMSYRREENPDTGEIIHHWHADKIGGTGGRISVEEIYNQIKGELQGHINADLFFTPIPDSARSEGVLSFTFDTSPPSDHTGGNLIIDLT